MREYLVYAVLGVVLLLVAVGVAWGGRLLWLRQVRRALVSLAARREAVRAADRALRRVVQALSEAVDAQLVLFATEHDSEERRAVEELIGRMRIVSDELATQPLPKVLWPTAETLKAAARAVLSEAEKVGEQHDAAGVLGGLASVDLPAMDQAVSAADEDLDARMAAFGVEEPAVYGGGLYI